MRKKENKVKLKLYIDKKLDRSKISLPKQVVLICKSRPIGWAFIEEKKEIYAELNFSPKYKKLNKLIKKNKDCFKCITSKDHFGSIILIKK